MALTAKDMIRNYTLIRDKLRKPPNAVPDKGINLRKRVAPKKVFLPTPESLKVLASLIEPPIKLKAKIMVVPLPKTPIKPDRMLRFLAIQRAVCAYFGISKENLWGRQRTNFCVYPRHVAWYLAAKHTDLSTPQISRASRLSSTSPIRDHTTIMHAKNKVADMMLVDEHTKLVVNLLEYMLLRGDYDDPPRSPVATEPQRDMAQGQGGKDTPEPQICALARAIDVDRQDRQAEADLGAIQRNDRPEPS